VFAAQMWGPFRPLDKATNQASASPEVEGSAPDSVERENIEEREVA
jgi:hypothetical protein